MVINFISLFEGYLLFTTLYGIIAGNRATSHYPRNVHVPSLYLCYIITF